MYHKLPPSSVRRKSLSVYYSTFSIQVFHFVSLNVYIKLREVDDTRKSVAIRLEGGSGTNFVYGLLIWMAMCLANGV